MHLRDAVNECCTVVHLAAIVGDPASRRLPKETRATNIDGARSLIRLAQERGVAKLVFVSTCSNYGIVPPGQLATEETVLRPLSLYAESKVQIERELMDGVLYDRSWDHIEVCNAIRTLATASVRSDGERLYHEGYHPGPPGGVPAS